jgi:hypothetical protein
MANEFFLSINEGVKGKPIITFLLSSLGQVPFAKTEIKEILVKTLDVLDELTGDTKIYLKPHYITDIDLLIEILKYRKKNKYEVSYLHPAVLASKSIFVICNCYSMAVIDSYYRGTPVIEYTDYKDDLLYITNYKSVGFGVDYFINNDISKLRKTIQSLMNVNTTYKPKIKYKNDVEFDYLFDLF